MLMLAALACTKDGAQEDSWTDEDCSVDDWAVRRDDPAAIHVRDDRTPGIGTGTARDPFAEIDEAIDALRADDGADTLVIGAGTWQFSVELDERDDGLTILGCGRDVTALQGAIETQTNPVLNVDGTQGLLVRDLSLWDGTRTVTVRGGAEATLRDVEVSGGNRLGVLVRGEDTHLTLEEVVIRDVEPDHRALSDSGKVVAYGLVVESSHVVIEGLGVEGATGVGVFATAPTDGGGSFDATGLSVTDTKPVEGYSAEAPGRGVHLQYVDTVDIRSSSLVGNSDAGLMALRIPSLSLEDLSIAETVGIDLDGTSSTGDGLVVTTGYTDGAEVADFEVTVSGLNTSNSARNGALFEGVTVTTPEGAVGTAADNAAFDHAAQYGATATATDVESLDDADAFGLHRDGVTLPGGVLP